MMSMSVEDAAKLSASDANSFAYTTIKDRLPAIYSKTVDQVYRQKSQHCGDPDSCEDLKRIVGSLSEQRYRLQTNKPLRPPRSEECEATRLWGRALEEAAKESLTGKVLPFEAPWLLVECHMYWSIWEAVQMSRHLTSLDPFLAQKRNSFVSSQRAVLGLSNYLSSLRNTGLKDRTLLRNDLKSLIRLSLWGNRFDLSLSGGEENLPSSSFVDQIYSHDSFILSDDSVEVIDLLIADSGPRSIDLVLDNAGFELFSDLCLADYLIDNNLVDSVLLHVKSIPWFVSDATSRDLSWTLEEMSRTADLAGLSARWTAYLEAGSWAVTDHPFWTSPWDFSHMESLAPDLYSTLSASRLVVFKGDLNYRKLVGDRRWPLETPLVAAANGFRPAPFVALRALKADTCCGLAETQWKRAESERSDWMVCGNYAVIQYCALNM